MNGVLVKLVGGLMALGMLGGSSAFAAVQNASITQTIIQDEPPTPGDRPLDGRRGSQAAALARHVQGQIADVTGLTGCDMLEARANGESFAEILEGAGVSPSEVADMALDTLTEKLNEAVTEGSITQAQADRVLENAPDRIDTFLTNTETDRAQRIYERFCTGETPIRDRIEARAAGIGAVIEEETGLDRCEILEQRATGESFAAILEGAGADPDAISAEALARLAEALDTAVAEGRLDAERAADIIDAAPDRIDAFLTNAETDRAERVYQRICTSE